MNEFEIVTVIQRPVDEVFAFVEKAENTPLYSPSVSEAHQTAEAPIGVGSTAVLVGKFLGRRFETTWEVFDYKLNERFASKTVSGPFDLEITNTFEPEGAGTKITGLYRGESRGFFKLAEPVIFRITKKQFEASAETMRELLEAEDQPGS